LLVRRNPLLNASMRSRMPLWESDVVVVFASSTRYFPNGAIINIVVFLFLIVLIRWFTFNSTSHNRCADTQNRVVVL